MTHFGWSLFIDALSCKPWLTLIPAWNGLALLLINLSLPFMSVILIGKFSNRKLLTLALLYLMIVINLTIGHSGLYANRNW